MKCKFHLFSISIIFFLWIFAAIPCVFTAVPIQGESINGAAAADARLRLLKTAESFLGTPYRYSGIDRKGLDCSGFVYLSFKESLNYTIPRSSGAIYSWVEKINTPELQIGDLVFFITTGPGVSHLGIYAGNGMFIHSASEGPNTGVIYSRLDEAYWKRTYTGAGRALPWDAETAGAMTAAINNPDRSREDFGPFAGDWEAKEKPEWASVGLYTGFGAAWTWGGFFAGSPSVFRGFSAFASAGYKWKKFRAGIDLRPQWDGALGVFRLPFTISAGTDIFQVFTGPAYTFGDPSLSLSGGERYYSGGGAWNWELGISGSLPPIKLSSGALSFYSELVWQPYRWESDTDFEFKPDMTANLRISTGLRYLWRL